VFEDEEYMTRVYGKASYQNKRTTVKDPYLHYQNIPKPKPDRPPGAPDVSSKCQTSSSFVIDGQHYLSSIYFFGGCF
jgi:hypothetical protein